MKKVLWLALMIGCFFVPDAKAQAPAPAAGAAAAPAGAPPAAQGRKKRVAVFDFDFSTVGTTALGAQVDIGKGITDLLVRYLVQDGTYSVVDRKAMDKILAEQNFSNSDRANPNSAAKLGKLMGVDAIIVGSVTQFGNETKNQNIGGGGGGWHGIGAGGFSNKKSKAIVGIDARMVDIDTSEILAVASGKGESKRESTSLTGGGSNWHGFGSGNVDFGSSDFQETILGEAVNLAVQQLSTGLDADASKLVARTVNVTGLVAAVDGGQIVLNVGGKAGLKVGDQLTIERVTKEIKDPNTGEVIRRMTTPIGTIKLTDVDDVSAVGSPVSGTDFQVGDMFKTVTQ